MSTPTALNTDFMFVNITRPRDIKNKKIQRKINSHVMKPIGLTRRCDKPNRKIQMIFEPPKVTLKDSKTAQDFSLTTNNTSATRNPACRKEKVHSPLPEPSLSLPSYQRPTSYPMSDRTTTILHFLCVADEAPVCKMMRELCFALAFVDDSAMHLVLARLEIDPERNGGRSSKDSSNTLSHYNASIEILRNQLGEPGRIAHEIIIGVIVNLACYDLYTDNLARWKTHLLGLQTMIQYRGGIRTLSSRYLQVAATWTDLIGSMIIDASPYFELQQVDKQTTVQTGFYNSDGFPNVEMESKTNIVMLLDLLSALSNLATGKSELDLSQDDSLLEALQATVHITLTQPRYDGFGSHNVSSTPYLVTHELVRLAVLIYLSGPAMFLAGTLTQHMIASHYRGKILRLYSSQRSLWAGLGHVELFVLVVAALGEVGENRYRLTAHLRQVMIPQGLAWKDLVKILHSMAWFDYVWANGLDKLRRDLILVDKK